MASDTIHLVDNIATRLLLNSSFTNAPGLNGQMGAAIFLLNYAHTSGQPVISNYVHELLTEITDEVPFINNIDYFSGLTGIAVSLSCLSVNEFFKIPDERFFERLHQRLLKRNDTIDFLSGLLGQSAYLAAKLPPISPDETVQKEYVSRYTFLEDALHTISVNFEPLFGHLPKEFKRVSYNPIQEQGLSDYMNMLYNLSRLSIFLQNCAGIGLHSKKIAGLSAEVNYITTQALDHHLLKCADLWGTRNGRVLTQFTLLHMLADLLNSKFITGESTFAEQRLAPLLNYLEELTNYEAIDEKITDALINISIILQSITKYSHSAQLQLILGKCMAIISHTLYNNGTLPPLHKPGIFHGWAKAGLLLHTHLHPDSRYKNWHYILHLAC